MQTRAAACLSRLKRGGKAVDNQGMESLERNTMAFEIWPYMVLIEGPATVIGRLLQNLYEDPGIERGRWTVDHTMRSRLTYAQHLQRGGIAKRRQGIGVKDTTVLEWVQKRCATYALECHLFGKRG